MNNKFAALINCKTKRELTTLCKNIEVNSQEFTEFIIGCKMGLTRLNHAMHYFDFVPEHLETRVDDWGILDADETTKKSSEGKKAIRRLFKSHGQRKYKVGHMFVSKELTHPLSEWHFVFFEINEINNHDNHWVLGAHFHIVNHHWPNLYCQEIWTDFVQNKVFPKTKLHVGYFDQSRR